MLHLSTLLLASLSFLITITKCQSFTSSPCHLVRHQHQAVSIRKGNYQALRIFHGLVSDEEEDLRAEIATIKKKDGLDDFLNIDDRLCLIKMHAPYCKACRAFGVKFRKLATDRGDRLNAAGEAIHSGDARFGEIEYSSSIKLCKDLGVKKFPTVLIFRGGRRLGEILCKQTAIENIVDEMDHFMTS